MSILPSTAALPDLGDSGFSLSSYNVLLPNSIDGWWIYKYYQPHVPNEHRKWPHRQELNKKIIECASADIVCLQECAAESFEDDWKFMKQAGYSYALHSKLRFRTATFWRDSRFELISQHDKDRTLVTALKFKPTGATLYICNCHLSAGPFPDKRLRQLHDSLEQVRKEATKAAPEGAGKKGGKCQNTPPPCSVVVCGDFNSDGYSGITELLVKGEVPGGYVDPQYSSVEMSSKTKKQTLGPFADSRAVVYGESRPPPSTFIAPLLDAIFVSDKEGGGFDLTDALKDGLRRAFESLSGGKGHMDAGDIEAWLIKINKRTGRGSESRSAAKLVEERGDGVMTYEDFEKVYYSELGEGKFWGVDYDLTQAIGTPVNKGGPSDSFQSTFDYIFYSTQTLEVECVRETLSEEDRHLASTTDPLPNSWQPSDHIMQSAAFRFSAETLHSPLQ